jgi:hypothetical protein
MKPRKAIYAFLMLIFLLSSSACIGDEAGPSVSRERDQTFIEDRTGRNWDITHAVKVYEMVPELFHFGLGIGAIPCVDNPVLVGRDSALYPDAASPFPVFGVDHNGEQRAYAVNDLVAHEVFNETYGGETQQALAITF